jgi:hypothetical protein
MVRTRAEEWRRLLRKHAPIARPKVRKFVEGCIVFTPDREARRCTFLATGTLANLFSGIVMSTGGDPQKDRRPSA